jgi:hypothetical protein
MNVPLVDVAAINSATVGVSSAVYVHPWRQEKAAA